MGIFNFWDAIARQVQSLAAFALEMIKPGTKAGIGF